MRTVVPVYIFGLISGLILISASGGVMYWFAKYEENPASHRQIFTKGRNILIVFLDNHEYSSLTLYPNLTYINFLKFICSLESEATSVYFSYSYIEIHWSVLHFE